MSKKILSIFGTRPEAIKMAPVIKALGNDSRFTSTVCVTAQHRQMLDQVLELFGIVPDFDMDLMTHNQDLFDVTAKSLLGIRDVLRKVKPDVVLVQGDTTTCFSGALAAFYNDVPVGHIEAGLRTGNLRAPFPEEANRVLTTRLASLHFPPTQQARENLLGEGISDENIWVTGNTVIDALLDVRKRVEEPAPGHWQGIFGADLYERLVNSGAKRILITGHRRENFGKGFTDLCNAIRQLASTHPDWLFIYPVHLNPNVREPVYSIIGDCENIRLIEPQDYAPFVWLMDHCDLVLTDSGGIQEEAPGLGKPVLVMRDVTERPEGIEAGTVRLVGTDTGKIIQGVESVLMDDVVYQSMSCAHNPYGDGKAASRILEALSEYS
jgi:UDP-N-acetylglucosamine 2-epimerase (non-hydrolysing)